MSIRTVLVLIKAAWSVYAGIPPLPVRAIRCNVAREQGRFVHAKAQRVFANLARGQTSPVHVGSQVRSANGENMSDGLRQHMPTIAVVTLIGIAIIGVAGSMKAASLSEEEKKAAVKDFNFPKGLAIALLAGFMSGCFNVGLEFGKGINFGELTDPMFRTLPATLLVTFGGFITNAIYCFYQNQVNKTWGDYKKTAVWGNNLLFCLLAGALWYSQFFGLALGKGFLTESPTLMTLSFCILMALNVVFSNVWGIILKEWKGCSQKTITVLIVGIVVLVISCFLPQLI
jgi:L-rhamnose-H+ transport protein